MYFLFKGHYLIILIATNPSEKFYLLFLETGPGHQPAHPRWRGQEGLVFRIPGLQDQEDGSGQLGATHHQRQVR